MGLRSVPTVEGIALAGMLIDAKYELTELIGEGAMGWVYRGTHLSLESSIAVKLMKPGAAGDTRDQRFEREARAASRLNNPHVISIIDFGQTPGGLLYIVSEFLRGHTLADLVAQAGALPLERAVRIMDQVLSAIDEAHSVQLVHRDLKPENIFITPLRSGEDFVKVLDFGIAKLAENRGERLTMQGQLFGTPAYMAPEQIRGLEATPRSDLYACGMILFELLTGRDAFPFSSVMEVLAAQLGQAPPTMREIAPDREIPEALEEVVQRCLAKDPAERFESAYALRKAIHRAAGFRRGFAGATLAGALCPECNRPVAVQARFCDQCGCSVSGAALAGPAPVAEESRSTLPPPPSPEIEWAETPSDVFDWGDIDGADAVPGPSAAVTREWAGRAATMHAGREPETLDGVPRVRRPRSTSEQYINVHSTLNRRLRTEQTLRFELVDREAELEAIAPVITGGGVAELLGPLGIGRSRLLEVAAEHAHREGLVVLRARSDPRLHRTPWYPIQRLVAAALGFDTAVRDLALLQQRAEAQGLAADDLLGLSVLFGLPNPQGPLELAVRRRETRSAALRALCQSEVARQGVCLLLDDADEYDAASQAFLRELLAHPSPGRRAVLLTGERSVLDAETARVVVRPSPLGEGDVEKLIRQAVNLSTVSGPQLLGQITARSEGNALHVTQAVRLLVEGGSEVDACLPDLLQTRISRLPGDSLRLLQMICILGREVPRAAVAALFEDDDLMERALQLLYRRGIVEAMRGQVFRVAHTSLAEVVREMMPADARRSLHLRALTVLAEQGEDPIALARHALEARAGEQTLEVLHAAGRRAEQRLDDRGAAEHYRQALQLARWELLYDEDDEQCLLLALRLGDALSFAGDLAGAELVFKEALGVSTRHPTVTARLRRSLARIQLRRGQHAEALSNFHTAVRLGLLAGDRELLAELYTNLGKALADLDRIDEAAQEMNEGVDLVTAGEGPNAKEGPFGFWRLLLQLGESHHLLGRNQVALEHAAAALDHARREGSLVGEARSHFVLAQVLDGQHQADAGDRHHAAALMAFRRLGDRQSTAECLLQRAAKCPDRSQDLVQQALSLSHQVAWAEGIRTASSLLANA